MHILDTIRQKQPALSKMHKLLADFVLKNFVDVSFMSITEFGEKTNVSPATITRFVRALGYKNYIEFQANMNQMVKREMEPTTEFKFNMRYVSSNSVFFDQIQDAKSDLDELYSKELNEALEASSKVLSKAKRIYILGSRTTFAVAYYCYFSLNRIMENVCLIENRNDDISISLQYVTKDDVLLAITYPKYTAFTLKVVKFFKDQGCQIVGITDRYTSPLTQYANHLLIVKNMLKIYFVTTFTIINALIILIGRYNPQAHIDMFDEENEITRRLGVYVTEEKASDKD